MFKLVERPTPGSPCPGAFRKTSKNVPPSHGPSGPRHPSNVTPNPELVTAASDGAGMKVIDAVSIVKFEGHLVCCP